MALTLIQPPDSEPVTLDELKDHLRVEFIDDDERLASYIAAATKRLDGRDGRLGRCLKPQTWELVLDCFPKSMIDVPLPPLTGVTSINYIDGNGVTQLLAANQYVVDTDSEPGRIVPAEGVTWPATQDTVNAVRIRFDAGYPDTADVPPKTTVPEPIRQAIAELAGHYYEHREAVIVATGFVKELPLGVEDLISDYRIRVT